MPFTVYAVQCPVADIRKTSLSNGPHVDFFFTHFSVEATKYQYIFVYKYKGVD